MDTSTGLLLRGCLFACSLGGLLMPVTASAHETTDAKKTVAECRALEAPSRGHCTECVSRPRKSHYHASAAEGARCVAAVEQK